MKLHDLVLKPLSLGMSKLVLLWRRLLGRPRWEVPEGFTIKELDALQNHITHESHRDERSPAPRQAQD